MGQEGAEVAICPDSAWVTGSFIVVIQIFGIPVEVWVLALVPVFFSLIQIYSKEVIWVSSPRFD